MGRAVRGWVGGVLAGLLFVVGLGLLGGSVARSVGGWSEGGGWFDAYDGRATATVLDIDGSPGSWDEMYGVDVSFEVDGATEVSFLYLDEGQVEDYLDGEHPRRGDTLEIAYDPEFLDDVVLTAETGPAPGSAPADEPAGGSSWLAVSGVLCLLGSFVVAGLTVVWVRRAPRPVPADPWRQTAYVGQQGYAPQPGQVPQDHPQPGPWSSPR